MTEEGNAILSIRWPPEIRDALVRLSAEHTLKTGQHKSVNNLLVEIIEQSLKSKEIPAMGSQAGKKNLLFFSLRLPVSLHQQLSQLAEEQSKKTGKRVSMNTITLAWIQKHLAESKAS